jgi:hypothetical protein
MFIIIGLSPDALNCLIKKNLMYRFDRTGLGL